MFLMVYDLFYTPSVVEGSWYVGIREFVGVCDYVGDPRWESFYGTKDHGPSFWWEDIQLSLSVVFAQDVHETGLCFYLLMSVPTGLSWVHSCYGNGHFAVIFKSRRQRGLANTH